jgi:hypothetical protein
VENAYITSASAPILGRTMYDPQAAFYGGYDRTNLTSVPLLRIRWIQVTLGFAVVVLLLFVAADAVAFSAAPVTVKVSSVTWATDGTQLATTSGLTVRGGQTFVVSLTCASVCFRFVGATANAPFTVVAFTTELQPIQFTNVTVRAPSSAYSGALTITLALPPTSDVAPRSV